MNRPPPRLLLLSSWTLDPQIGTGTATAITGLAAGLEALGCRVDLLGPRRGRPGGLLTRLGFNLALRRPLRRATARDPGRRGASGAPDAIVGFDLDGCFLPAAEELDGGAPLRVVSLKGVAADERRFESGAERLRFGLLAALERRNARRADRVLVTSEYCRRRATASYGLEPERLRVVPEGIDLEAWERAEPTPERRGDERDGPSPVVEGAGPWRGAAGPVLLNVARQYRRKNTRVLLDAFPAVVREHPGARLRIVGGGPELPALRRRAQRLGLGERVRFLGEVPDQRGVRLEYAGADLFCLPSRQEGFGIVLLEAMAAELPIVAADAGAIPEVAPAGEVALLVEPGDSEALAEGLLRALGDRALRRRLAGAGGRRVREYAWPVVARRFLQALGLGRPAVG